MSSPSPVKRSFYAHAGPLFARRVSPIVLYHATFTEVPDLLGPLVHNVHPDRLVEQVQWLADQFELVSVDDWFTRDRPMGTACVTFDDGYLSALEHAIPRLIDMGIPSTVFLNCSSLAGEIYWRDRVVFVINQGLVDDFLASYSAREAGVDDIPADRFYNMTRRWPGWSSRAIDQAIDQYLRRIGRLDDVPRYTVHYPDQLIDHPLVTYGDHTYRHYVPISLTPAEQEEEFVENQRALDGLGVRRSRVFSIPFGDETIIDETTMDQIRRHGYLGVLYSRHQVNRPEPADLYGFPAGERYMVPDDVGALMERHVRLGVIAPQAPARRAARWAADLVRT